MSLAKLDQRLALRKAPYESIEILIRSSLFRVIRINVAFIISSVIEQ